MGMWLFFSDMGCCKTKDIYKFPEKALEDVLKPITKNKVSTREASRKFNIPTGTLQNRPQNSFD